MHDKDHRLEQVVPKPKPLTLRKPDATNLFDSLFRLFKPIKVTEILASLSR